MAITDRGTASGTTTGTSLTVTGVPAPAANSYVLVAVGVNPGESILSVTGGTGTFGAVAVLSDASFGDLSVWIGYNFGSSAPTSVTINRAGTGGGSDLTAVVRTLDAEAPVTAFPSDVDYNYGAGTGTSANSGAVTPDVGDILFAAILHIAGGSSAQTPTGNTYTGNAAEADGANTVEQAWCEAASAVSSSLTWTLPGSSLYYAINVWWTPPPSTSLDAPPASAEALAGGSPVGPIEVAAPPALSTARTYRPGLGLVVNAPVAKAVAATPYGSIPIPITAPAADATGQTVVPVPEISVSLSYPADLQRVPILTPVLSFVVTAIKPARFSSVVATVQIDTDPAFGDPTELQFAVLNYIGAATTVACGLTLAEDTRYYWRARAAGEGGASGWSAVKSFYPDPDVGAGAAYGHWNVVDAPPIGHLWFLVPDHGQPGDTIRLIGKGLGVTTVDAVNFGAETATPTDWDVVPAGGDAYTEDRLIDPQGTINVEHDVVTVVVPDDVAAPGVAVSVVGS